MSDTAALIVQSWTDLATDTVARWAQGAKALATAQDRASQATAVQGLGGAAVSGAVGAWATLLEVLALLAEPVEGRQWAESKPHVVEGVLATEAVSLSCGTLEHTKDATCTIPASEVLVHATRAVAVTKDPAAAADDRLWIRVRTWINGRKPGQYAGEVTVVRPTPGAASVTVAVTIVI